MGVLVTTGSRAPIVRRYLSWCATSAGQALQDEYDKIAQRGGNMRTVLGGCMVGLVVLAGVLAHAVEPLVLYDDFNAARIDTLFVFGLPEE